jgi:hypothetical protein
MRKLYIVRLTKQERVELQSVVKKLKGTGQKVRRAQILLKADAAGPNWIDERIAEAYACRTRRLPDSRLCTCTLRINTPGSPTDRHKDKKV